LIFCCEQICIPGDDTGCGPADVTNIVAPVSTSTTMDDVAVAAREILFESRMLAIVDEFGLASPGAYRRRPPSTGCERTSTLNSRSFVPDQVHSPNSTNRDVTQELTDLFLERQNALQTNQVKPAQNLIDGRLAERRQRLSHLEDSIAPRFRSSPRFRPSKIRAHPESFTDSSGRRSHYLFYAL
jgi:hypothetical protein